MTELEINLRLPERPDQVVRDFTNPRRTFATSQGAMRKWFIAIRQFGRLARLNRVSVDLLFLDYKVLEAL